MEKTGVTTEHEIPWNENLSTSSVHEITGLGLKNAHLRYSMQLCISTIIPEPTIDAA